MPSLPVLLVVAALLAAPAAAGLGIANPSGATATRLHFHVLDALQDFPINTQPAPPGEAMRPGGTGLGMQSLSCVPSGTPLDSTTQNRYATFYGYLSAGLVDFEHGANGSPRLPGERGMVAEARLDPGADLALDWYVTTYAVLPADPFGAPHADPVLPNVVARATVRTGEGISLGDTSYNAGRVVAQGQTPPTTLAGANTYAGKPGDPHPQVTADPQADGGTVYGFHFALKPQLTVLPREGFNVRIDLFVSLPTCDMGAQDRYVMPGAVLPHSDPAHRPGLTLTVLNPLRVESVRPVVLGDDVAVQVALTSPWGGYDVPGLNLTITGPGGPVTGVFVVPSTSIYEHNGGLRPVRLAFVWPFRQQDAPDGAYAVHLEARNRQGSANATADTTFELGDELWATACGRFNEDSADDLDTTCVRELQDGNGGVLDTSQRSPSLQLLGALAALGGVAVLLRRRD